MGTSNSTKDFSHWVKLERSHHIRNCKPQRLSFQVLESQLSCIAHWSNSPPVATALQISSYYQQMKLVIVLIKELLSKDSPPVYHPVSSGEYTDVFF